MRTSEGPVSSTTRRKSSKSSIPACRVRVIPVSGAQHASAQGILHAGVHPIYTPEGKTPRLDRSDRRGIGLLQRELQRAVATEFRAAAIQISAERGRDRPCPDVVQRASTRVAQNPASVWICASAYEAPVA